MVRFFLKNQGQASPSPLEGREQIADIQVLTDDDVAMVSGGVMPTVIVGSGADPN